jgi:hypothetical protein
MLVAAVAHVANGGVGLVLSNDTYSVEADRLNATNPITATIGRKTVFISGEAQALVVKELWNSVE